MGLVANFMLAAGVIFPAIALAQSPFQISGLHTDLVYTEAVAQAQRLGGNCQRSAEWTTDGESVQCEYSPCLARNTGGKCIKFDLSKPGLTIAAQPILWIVLEAPAKPSRLTRISILYEGDNDVVAASLQQAFGSPDAGAPTPEKSWSHARRLEWTKGNYRRGFLDSPQMIILASEQAH